MAVIDIHEHIATRPGFPLAKRKDYMTTAQDLVRIMDQKRIDRMAVLPLVSPEALPFVQSPEEVFEACDRFPGRFIKFCNVDPRIENNRLDYDFEPMLRYYQSLGAKGLGEMTVNIPWSDVRVQNLFRACEAVGFPVIYHLAAHEFNCYGLVVSAGLAEIEKAAQTFPKLTFLGHSMCWWSEVGPNPTLAEREGYPTGPVAPGGRVPELMRKYPNLCGDLSGRSGSNGVSRDPEWGWRFLEEFQDQLFMGLDICYPSNDACSLLTFINDAVARGKISRKAYDKIMGGNAERLLALA